MLGSIWIVQRGFDVRAEFVKIVDGAVTWVSDRSAAEPFDTKADALAVAEAIFAGSGATIATFPLEEVDRYPAGSNPCT